MVPHDSVDGGSWEGDSYGVEPGHGHSHELEPEPDPDDVPIEFQNFDWTRDQLSEPQISARRTSQPAVQVQQITALGVVPRHASVDSGIPPAYMKAESTKEKDRDSPVPTVPVVVVTDDQPQHNEGASALGHGNAINRKGQL